jgi:hypothetical protein
VVQQVDDPVPDQRRGRVMTRDDELEQAREDLLLRQGVVVARRHENTDEVVLRRLAVAGHELCEAGHDEMAGSNSLRRR